MNELSLDTMKHRLNRLEREVHRWKVSAALSAVGLALIVLTGAVPISPQKEIRAQRFIIVDDDGIERATLESKAGLTRFTMLSESSSKIEMAVGSRSGGSFLTVRGNGTHNSVGIWAIESPFIALETSSSAQILLQTPRDTPDPKLGITLMRTLASLSLTDGKPNLSMYDAAGNARNVMGYVSLENTATGTTIQTSESALTLFGKDGKVIWQGTVDKSLISTVTLPKRLKKVEP
jgi:hypothetical protein